MVGKGSCRVLVAAFGDAGHAFPAIGLARALARRGHEVTVETWEHWREAVEGEGLQFTAAEEYKTFPPPPPGSVEGPSAGEAALALLPLMEEERFDVVVSDILTVAPALAAERAGLRRATLIPHVYPVHDPGLPFFAFGAQPPRTPVGRAMWRAALPALVGGLRRGRRELNETREVAGLAPIERFHGGISEELALVATFPQLEYPRRWPAHVHVTGPITFELPADEIDVAEGDEPLVLVAPSTAHDPECRLVRVTLEALADEPMRVVATTNRHRPEEPLPAPPANAVVVDWLSYSQLMPLADLVITHGGHGTVARALGAGTPVLCCPAVGDMAENAARVAWAGAGLMLPWRLTTPRAVRIAVRRLLGEPQFATRASAIGASSHDEGGVDRGAELVEALAGRRRQKGLQTQAF
jgi:MGT family glycosyltransferase